MTSKFAADIYVPSLHIVAVGFY